MNKLLGISRVFGFVCFPLDYYNFLNFFFPLSLRQTPRQKKSLKRFLFPNMLSNLVWLFLLKHASILHGSNN